MFRFFSQILKQNEYQKLFNEALLLSKQGNKEKAFDKFNSLLQEFPADVHIRRQVINLGEALNKPVNLPNLSPKSPSA